MTPISVTVDTNVLVRAIVEDDPEQAAAARDVLAMAARIVVPVMVVCELAWVLARGYRYGAAEIARVIGSLIEIGNVVTDRAAVEAGVTMLRKGGDFADGVIAFQGEAMGGSVFASFDQEAVKRLRQAGAEAADPVELLSSAGR